MAPVGICAIAAGEVTHRGEALHRRHDEETGADDRRIVADRVADGLRDAATLDRREYPGLAQHGLVTVRPGVPGRAAQDHRGAVCPNQHEEVVLGSATEQSARDHRTISGGWTLGDPGLQGRPVQQAVTVLQQRLVGIRTDARGSIGHSIRIPRTSGSRPSRPYCPVARG